MDNDKENEFNSDKKDRELILFDKGLNEIPYNEKKEKENTNKKRKNINWFTVYMILFKNTLNSKNLVPKEELKLRLSIIRKYLPPFYNCQKNIENSNTNSILKKFSYHLYSKSNLMQRLIEKKNTKKILDFDEDNEDDSIPKIYRSETVARRRTKTKTEKFSFSKLNLFSDKKHKQKKSLGLFKAPLEIVEENNDEKLSSLDKRNSRKRGTLKSSEKYLFSGNRFNINLRREELSKKTSDLNKFYEIEKNIKVKFGKKNTELNKINNNKDVVIRTPNDSEYPLVLTEKRLTNNNNNNQTYFMDFLNKLNEETKSEKINSYKKEVTSQILKFNEMFFDTKMDDFSKDNLFNELKSTCDMFINKFSFDTQEEKNLGDLDKFL